MTSLTQLYDAFLSLIQEDEWESWSKVEREQDWYQIYLAASPWFKFPRIKLDVDLTRENFINNVTNAEIQVLAHYMKTVWLGRLIDSWENLRPMYQERDFSPAKMLGEFEKRYEGQLKLARRLEATYYRSRDGSPFPYDNLGGIQ